MAQNDDDPVAGDQLKSIVERIERLDDEIGDLNGDKKEVYAEAKGNGYDVHVIRKIIAIRKRDPNERAEEEAIMDLYLQAVGESRDVVMPSGTKPATRAPAPKRQGVPQGERAEVLPGNEALAYARVKEVVITERICLATILQKRFNLTSARVGVYLDLMEDEGILSAFTNGKRVILVPPPVSGTTVEISTGGLSTGKMSLETFKTIANASETPAGRAVVEAALKTVRPTKAEMDAAKELAKTGVSMEVSGPGNDVVFKRVAAAAEAAGIPVKVNPPIVGSFTPDDEAEDPFGAS